MMGLGEQECWEGGKWGEKERQQLCVLIQRVGRRGKEVPSRGALAAVGVGQESSSSSSSSSSNGSCGSTTKQAGANSRRSSQWDR